MSFTNFKKICCNFAEIKLILKNPRWRSKWRICCETTVAIAAALNKNFIVVMKTN